MAPIPSDEFQLNITPLKLSEIPDEATILEKGKAILDSTGSWKPGKSFYHGTVKTISRPKEAGDGAPWHGRISEHTREDATFDEFWSKLGVDKAENEKNYIADIKKVAKVKEISPNMIVWTLYYTFPPPVSPRVFTVVQITHLESTSPRSGWIISLPVDLSSEPELAKLEEKGVKGRYVSVERILELPDGKVEWRMATSSTPGGSIPTFVAERSMPGKISDDVPHFLKWFHSIRATPTITVTDPTPTGTAFPAEPSAT
ncbi:hypothetical protein PUNSTDRAFT_104692 [Punctularia strigosozonata HHB-11173 SS5]|uniref:uncharacterized protein n=1 Tax=Punctularia strigosozonata (strain HHB-11173) TaxID=741275 RepID=UPI0004416C65|nr:uncharacterized protein PUNSTDRAFT_104692 [Punctularia strigosozonata HHB-11173 SS5]EIN07161.1 hypothetical protein PUNSTDRAFT_104692 [Punctularia strigosozonata HHB-11173 SS5]